jgi:hypothetical protein
VIITIRSPKLNRRGPRRNKAMLVLDRYTVIGTSNRSKGSAHGCVNERPTLASIV